MMKDTPPKNTKKRGRPRIYASAAERQRAYRLRRRAEREVAAGTPLPLRSTMLDLSAVRPWLVARDPHRR